MLMDCYVCGKRATKLRKMFGRLFGLCKNHGINDLAKFEWLNI